MSLPPTTRFTAPRRSARVFAALVALLLALPVLPTSMVGSASAQVSVVLDGRAQWHGWGMSQYGAFGYAVDFGWNKAQILDHYYGGTVAGSVPATSTVAVRLRGVDLQQTAVVSATGRVRVDNIPGTAPGAPWVSVVARWNGNGYTVWGRSDREVCPSAGDDLASTGWTPLGTVGAAGSADPGRVVMRTALTNSGTAVNYSDLLSVCHPTGEVRAYRGAIIGTLSGTRTLNVVPMESYLRSVVASEMIPSWGTAGGGKGSQALQAQAVAARSYSASDHRELYPSVTGTVGETCDTTACQAYPGAARRSSLAAGFTRVEYDTTDAAVQVTVGEVRRVGTASGPIARTYFSASNGGATSPGPGELAPFPAVIDRGDATASNPYTNPANPLYNLVWSTTLTGTAISTAYPAIGSFRTLEVVGRTCVGAAFGGRVTSLRLTGSAGAVTTTGDAFTASMGLKSNWFAVRGAAPYGGCLCAAPPLEGGETPAPAARFTPLANPIRLVDTRFGVGAATAPLGAGCTLVVDPNLAPTVTAVVVNLTAVQPAAKGFVAAYPCGVQRPVASALQGLPGRAVAGAAVVPLGVDGTFCVYTSAATHLVVDLFGTYSSASGTRFEPLTPQRAYASSDNGAAVLTGGSTTTVAMVGRNGLPADATGVSLTVHAFGASAGGFVTVYPCGGALPAVSTANVVRDASVTNFAQVALGVGGAVCVFVSTGMHVLLDVNGWFGPGATTDFYAVTPLRVLDTRFGVGLSGAFTANQQRSLQIAGTNGLPAATTVRAIVAIVTAVAPVATGEVVVHACLAEPPPVSMVRFTATGNADSTVVNGEDGSGAWCISASGTVHVIADVSGYYG